MPDPSERPSDQAASPAPPAASAEPVAPDSAAEMPSPGTRWMGTYAVKERTPWAEGEEAWLAMNPMACEEVIIIKVRTADPLRDKAYDALHTVDSPYITAPADSRLVLEERFEIYIHPEGPTLRKWIDDKHTPTTDLITRWMKCFADALGKLHDKNVVHCHLDPERIFLVKSDTAVPNLVIGGLERSLRFDRKELVPIHVDPFYAPPEAAGLFRHASGDGLKAWDWWTVGRIIQEIVLGRHILEHLVDNPLGHNGQDEREFAEKLLLEKAHGETKAGGVEAMPPMDKRIDLLLLGLLSSCRDARWGIDEVRKWIKGENPKERYKLPKTERLFKWQGKAYTVHDAADIFRQAEHWDQGADQILRKDDPASLISFIREQPNLRPYGVKTEEVLQLISSAELKQFPPLTVREVMVAHCLHRVAGGTFVWKGRRMDSGLVREILSREDGKGDALKLIQTLCSGALLPPLEKLDFEAFRILGEGSRLAVKAVEAASRLGQLTITDMKETAKLWIISFESPSAWAERIKTLRDTYAASEKTEIQELFAKERATPEETIVLTWLIPNAAKLGFVTHEEWDKREYGKLHERGLRLARGIFWVRLRRALDTGAWWFGPLYLLLLGWTALTAMVAIAWPGPFYAPLLVLPLLSAFTMRMSLRSLVHPLMKAYAKGHRQWGLFEGSARCRAEAAKIPESKVPLKQLKLEVEEINEALSKLTHLDPPPTLIPLPPRMISLRLIALSSWFMLILPAALTLDKVRHSENPWTDFVYAWFPPEEDLEYYEPPPAYKIDFPFAVPKNVQIIKPKATEPASELEVKLGLRRGEVQAHGYILETIPAMLLVRVPTQEQFSFVLYDPKKNLLGSKNVYHLNSVPKRRSCVNIDGKTAFILDY